MTNKAACKNRVNIDDNKNEVICLNTAKLIKLKNQIKKLKNEVLEGYIKEMQDCKSAFNEVNNLIGELNESGGKK